MAGLFSWQIGRLFGAREGGHEEAAAGDVQKVALILGVTGIVGNHLAALLCKPETPGGPWKVYGAARKPKPEWLSHARLEYVQCDFLDREQTVSRLSPLRDVTHVFYVTWVGRDSEAENIEANGRMFQNTLDALLPHAKCLRHIVLQTGSKHYIGPSELTGKLQPQEPPFREDLPRLPCDQFYHTQEDILQEAVAKHKEARLAYSIHRPNVIFGFAVGNLMNMVGTLAVYALICKHEGQPLVYPGNRLTWDYLSDASDAELIAEQEIWACVETDAKNQAFNITNGDVFKWKRLWHLLAERFGVKVPEYSGKPTSLAEMMKGKEAVWEKIVKENGLKPVKLGDIGHWWSADLWLNQEVENVSSMNKSREFGFLGWRNTEKTFLAVLDKMKEQRVIP